jgi:hypothetical protein
MMGVPIVAGIYRWGFYGRWHWAFIRSFGPSECGS